jgi:regulator of RNase E activity RraB
VSKDFDFPDDENGHVLRHMAGAGVDLTIPRNIEFAHRAPDEASANAFAHEARNLGYSVKVYEPDEESLEEDDTDWDVICTREMIPIHADITAAETELAELADEHDCFADGWGFLE